MTNGLSHPYHLDEPIVIFRGTRCNFSFLYPYFDENPVGKQSSPRWEAAFYGVTSGGYSVCLCPIKRTLGLYGLNNASNAFNIKMNIQSLRKL